MGAKSREKGRKGESQWVHVLRAHGIEARRGVQHKGGPDAPDIIDDLALPVHWEVKRVEALKLHAARAQAAEEAAPGELPIVVSRRNRDVWVAHLDGEALVDLLRAAAWVLNEAGHRSPCESNYGGTACDCGLDELRGALPSRKGAEAGSV